MLHGPSQILNPLAASRPFGYGTGPSGGGAAAPATPTGFAASPSDQQIDLTWTSQPEADTFTIRYALTNNFGSSVVLTDAAAGTSFQHNSGSPGFVVGEKYYYWIAAVNGDGTSDYSSSVTARSYITVANFGNVSLTTPSGSWTFGTLFFGATPTPLPDYLNIIAGSVTGLTFGGEWLDAGTEESINADPISGAFSLTNSTGASFTFWASEP